MTPRYYSGPWQWDDSDKEPCWRAPAGCIGTLDVRPLPEQAVAGGDPGMGIFTATEELGSDYEFLGEGDPSEVKIDQRLRDAFPRVGKRQPQGDTLLGLTLDLMTDGSDPTGDDGPKPILPIGNQQVELCLGEKPHRTALSVDGTHWGKVVDVIKNDMRLVILDAKAGLLKDSLHDRRVLDSLCDKYRVPKNEWQILVPADLVAEIDGPLKHETSYSDAFTRSDASTLGASWTAIITTGTQECGISTNNCRLPNTGNVSADTVVVHRYDSDLSSVDQECSLSHVSDSFSSAIGSSLSSVICRKDSTATITFYTARLTRTGDGSSYTANNVQLFKFLSGTATQLGSNVSVTPSLPDPIKVYASGSTIKSYYDSVERHSQTDTAITTGLRCGMRISALNNTAWRGDDWSATDLAASGLGMIFSGAPLIGRCFGGRALS